jgi:hypothetical protein
MPELSLVASVHRYSLSPAWFGGGGEHTLLYSPRVVTGIYTFYVCRFIDKDKTLYVVDSILVHKDVL